MDCSHHPVLAPAIVYVVEVRLKVDLDMAEIDRAERSDTIVYSDQQVCRIQMLTFLVVHVLSVEIVFVAGPLVGEGEHNADQAHQVCEIVEADW